MSPQHVQVSGSFAATATLIGERIMATVTLAAVVGCASCPPFRASWYLEEAPAKASAKSSATAASDVNASGTALSATSAASAASVTSAESAATAASAVGPPIVYLALLNEGRETVRLTQVVVNSSAPWVERVFHSPVRRTGHMVITPPNDEETDENKKAKKGGSAVDAKPVGDNQPIESGKPYTKGEFAVESWKPGELLVFKVMDTLPRGTEGHACSVPVTVQIQCGEGCSKTQPVSGALPNYLHKSWVDHCQPLRRKQ